MEYSTDPGVATPQRGLRGRRERELRTGYLQPTLARGFYLLAIFTQWAERGLENAHLDSEAWVGNRLLDLLGGRFNQLPRQCLQALNDLPPFLSEVFVFAPEASNLLLKPFVPSFRSLSPRCEVAVLLEKPRKEIEQTLAFCDPLDCSLSAFNLLAPFCPRLVIDSD